MRKYYLLLLAFFTIIISYASDQNSCTVYNTNGITATLEQLSIKSNSEGTINYAGLITLSDMAKKTIWVNVDVLDYRTNCLVKTIRIRIGFGFRTNSGRFEKEGGFSPNTIYKLRIGGGTCE